MADDEPAWVVRVKQVCDSTLRSIVYLSPDTREVVFVRDDIDSVPADRLDRAFQTLMLDVLGVDSDEQTYEHGDLLFVSRRFDHAVELHFPLSKTEGVAIALDAAAVDQMDDPEWHLYAIIADAE